MGGALSGAKTLIKVKLIALFHSSCCNKERISDHDGRCVACSEGASDGVSRPEQLLEISKTGPFPKGIIRSSSSDGLTLLERNPSSVATR